MKDKNFVIGFCNIKNKGEVNSYAEIDLATWDTMTEQERAKTVREQLEDNVCEDGYIWYCGLYASDDAEGFSRTYSVDDTIKLTVEGLERNDMLKYLWDYYGYSSYEDLVADGLVEEDEEEQAD